MKVSVVIPFKNAEYTLSEAILSIQKQTLRECEILLIDNASTDRSLEIALRHQANDPRIKVISEPKQGVVAANNLGVQEAQGKYIARMDADDVAFPERLEKQVTFLEQNPSIGVVSGLVEHWSQVEDSRGIAHFVGWVNSLTTIKDIYLNRFIELLYSNFGYLYTLCSAISFRCASLDQSVFFKGP